MNLNNIIGEIEKIDAEVYERLDTRRSAMKSFAGLGGKLALAAVPAAFGSLFQKAYAGNRNLLDSVVDILNYALTLEYLESAFYTAGLSSSALIPSGPATAAIQTISAHETAHVAFLTAGIRGASGTPVAKPEFDFTAKQTFPDVFSNYVTFLAVAQAFEDTGVRAYKGRAAELVKGGDLLTVALNIHSVEARHAAHIRQMRKAAGVDVKPWITGVVSGIGPATAGSYAGEDNTKQATIEIVNINGTGISTNAATEAFDEGLTKEQVLAIVGPFFK